MLRKYVVLQLHVVSEGVWKVQITLVWQIKVSDGCSRKVFKDAYSQLFFPSQIFESVRLYTGNAYRVEEAESISP